MIDRHIEIQTPDGAMSTFVTHPDEDRPHPVVLFYMDAPGKREELRDLARRIGTAGYYVVLPNLYYRTVAEFDLFSDARKSTACGTSCSRSRVGAVGYCMSGPFVCAMAGMLPDRIRAAASFYGVRLHGKHSPEDLAANVTGELYFGCAEHDEFAPKEMVDDLERHLSELGLNARVEWYPGTHHRFAFPSREGAHDKDACERHYERLYALLDRNLR